MILGIVENENTCHQVSRNLNTHTKNKQVKDEYTLTFPIYVINPIEVSAEVQTFVLYTIYILHMWYVIRPI